MKDFKFKISILGATILSLTATVAQANEPLYSQMKFQCYDGYSETLAPASCQTYSVLSSQAEQICASRCYGGKCGVNGGAMTACATQVTPPPTPAPTPVPPPQPLPPSYSQGTGSSAVRWIPAIYLRAKGVVRVRNGAPTSGAQIDGLLLSSARIAGDDNCAKMGQLNSATAALPSGQQNAHWMSFWRAGLRLRAITEVSTIARTYVHGIEEIEVAGIKQAVPYVDVTANYDVTCSR